MSRQWVVVGSRGMLGKELVAVLEAEGVSPRALDRAALDVTDADACLAACRGADVVVNCTAWTAVDAAETAESAAFDVNATGAHNLAAAAARAGARLVHVSTDYVFDGAAVEPYDEDALLAPRSAYGRTKAAGEWAVRSASSAHLVLRTAWLYGDGPCFPRTVASILGERGAMSVVDDQVGQPTWTRDVAQLVLRLVAAEAPGGVYHATSTGRCSWYRFAGAVASSAGADETQVTPTTSAAFVRPAARPAWSVLGHTALERVGVRPIGPWEARWAEAAPHVLVRG